MARNPFWFQKFLDNAVNWNAKAKLSFAVPNLSRWWWWWWRHTVTLPVSVQMTTTVRNADRATSHHILASRAAGDDGGIDHQCGGKPLFKTKWTPHFPQADNYLYDANRVNYNAFEALIHRPLGPYTLCASVGVPCRVALWHVVASNSPNHHTCTLGPSGSARVYGSSGLVRGRS